MNRKLTALLTALALLMALCSVALSESLVWIEEEAVTEISAQDVLPDSDALAEGFIIKTMRPQRRLFFNRTLQRSKLGEAERNLYDLLRADIEAIANGTRPSTVMEYSADAIYPQTVFTAEELGVSSILYVDDNGKAQFTAEASAALAEKRKLDSGKLLSALLVDCPYELYWFNKTANAAMTIGYAGISSNGVTATSVTTVRVSFKVSTEYSDGDQYTCDTTYGASARAAADTAQSIVNSHLAEDDRERLEAYASEICSLVSYNYDALAEGTPYGNPWQLVWVFDGNPETNVVCEGYSKAFQFLCDLSDFTGSVRVLTVSGTMAGGTGAGNHMWNLVRLPDGHTRLVDVTNIDSGSIGYPDQLLLATASTGSVDEGYTFTTRGGGIAYYYNTNTRALYNDTELCVAFADELSTVPVPVFTPGRESILINEGLAFFRVDNGVDYDSCLAEILHTDASGVTTDVSGLNSVFMGTDEWDFGIFDDYAPGTYTVRFAGLRGGVQSGWSEPYSFTPEVIAATERIDFTCEVPSEVCQGDETHVTWEETAGAEQFGLLLFRISGGERTLCSSAWYPGNVSEADFSWAASAGEYELQLSVNAAPGYHFIEKAQTRPVRVLPRVIVTDPEQSFPDAAFRGYVMEHFDLDADGKLSEDEVNAVTSIDCTGLNVESLQGAEIFTGLENLVCTGCAITALDLSGFQAMTEISEGAFAFCSGLTDVIFPDSLTGIGPEAFTWCSQLTELSLPENLVSIGESAFYGCSNIASVTIPGSVSSIGQRAFNLDTGIIIPVCGSPAQQWADAAGYTLSVKAHQGQGIAGEDIAPTCMQVGYHNVTCCSVCGGVIGYENTVPVLPHEYHVEEALWTDEPHALWLYSTCALCHSSSTRRQLDSILTLPAGLTAIDEEAFVGIAAEAVIVPAACESIGRRAFADCPALLVVLAPEGISIAEDAFEGCGDGLLIQYFTE